MHYPKRKEEGTELAKEGARGKDGCEKDTFWFQDTTMDCEEGDAAGLDELVDLATDVADSSPTIRGN